MAQPISQLLAKRLLLTNFEDETEEYILTKEEENKAIEHEVERLEKHYAWKMYDKGINSQAEIIGKLADIDLIDRIDVIAILERANSIKHHNMWQFKQRKKEKEDAERKQQELKEKWTANMVYRQIKWASQVQYGKPLIVNNDTMQIIKPLCFFISGDERFETELGYSFNKGICFRGISGLGKTFIVQCAAENEIHPISILSMLEIAADVKDDGEFNLPQGFSKFYIDDVGSEEHIQNHYGTKINWFKNFIETFYLRSKQYNRLIISTNNTASQIEEKYGFRVRSRFKDIFNVIDVSGKDLRG